MPLYLVAAYWYCNKQHQEAVCSGVSIIIKDSADIKYLTSKHIATQIEEQKLNPVGSRVIDIDLKGIEDSIKSNPIVLSVNSYTTASGSTIIEVNQRKPIMRIISANSSYYLDTEGELLPLSPLVTEYLPITTGDITKEFAQEELFPLAKYLTSNKKWNNHIEQIHINSKKEMEIVPRVGAELILMGKISTFEKKFSTLELFYNKALKQVGYNKYSRIDLTYNDRVICTKRYE